MMIPKSIATAALRTRSFVVRQNDGITPYTGSLSGADVQLSKAGGANVNAVGAATLLNATTGRYKIVLDPTDIDTDGELVLEVVKTGVQSLVLSLGQVVDLNPYDAIRAGLTGIRPDAELIGTVTSGTLTATAFSTNLTIPSGQLAGVAYWRWLGNVTSALAGQVQKITAYTSGLVTVGTAFSTAPSIGDQGEVVNG